MFAVGYVHRPHGLNGEVSVEKIADTDDIFAAGEDLIWIRGESRRELKVASSRTHGERLLISFEGVGDANAARELAGGALCREGLPERPEGSYWSQELRGFRCEDREGRELGAVRELEETPAGPQLTLDAGGGREVLVPFVQPIVVEIDREGRRIVLDPPEGLMDL